VRAAEHTFAELAAAAERDPESLDRLAIDALPNPQRRVLAVLALAAGALLPPDLVSAMASVADIREAISELNAHGLAERHEDRFGLPICKVDTYRPQLLTYVDAGSAARELIGWLTSRDPADHVSLSVAEAALSLIGFAAEQGDLRTVVALVRVVEPILTLAGRWQVYSQALHQGMQAAQQLGDQVSQAYFAHQQGTLALCQDQLPAAQQHLHHALELRRRLGDRRGAERTQHNLKVLQPTPPPPPPRPRRKRRVSVGLIMACLVLAVILGSWIAIGAQSPQPGGGPVARLEVTPSSGPAPLQITASGSTSKAGKGATITSYDFDFGDGNTTGPKPKATVKHTYKRPGTYTVTLTVTNSADRTDQTTQDVTVTKPLPSDPTATLRVTPRSGPAPLQITADGSTSTAGQGATITSYDFDFGDGHKTGPQSEPNAKHTYKRPSPGEPAKTYTVTLTVTNSAGRTDQTTHDVTVTGSPTPKPVARLTVTSEGGYAGADGSASTAGQGATITSYDFDFGDGHKTGPQSEPNAKHTYKRPSPGEPAKTYTVTLTVTNSAGRTDQTTHDVTITGSPDSGSGGKDSGSGGKDSGSGGKDSGSGGKDSGSGGKDSGSGGKDSGSGGTDPGSGGTDPGSCEPGFFWNGNKCVKAPG
jgi:PKD repeat protein